MRQLLWGQYPAQQADFTLADMSGCSIIVDGAGSNQAGTTLYNPNTIPLYNLNPYAGGTRKQLIKIALAKVRAQVGHNPTLIAARLRIRMTGATNTRLGYTIGLYRLLTTPDWADVNGRYRDVSATTPWGRDASIYSPVPGLDHQAAPFSTCVIPASASLPEQWLVWDITTELAFRLAANQDLSFMLWQYPIRQTVGTACTMEGRWKGSPAYYPYLELLYMLPVEGFGAKSTGGIDLTNILDNALDIASNNLNLGSGEIGQTFTPVKAYLKNFANRIIPHLELLGGVPEWSTPAAGTSNAGDGALARVTLANDALSQQWTVKFTSATDFQIQALAYKDYATSLNPSFGGAGWTGDTSTDFTSPSGGLTIPAAAWSGTPVANDTFLVYTTGQTTDASWPADSDDQVQIAKDDAGDPDADTWRPVLGHRTYLTSPVTIDGTSKTLDVRYINTALWPDDAKIFVADADNIDEGVITAQTDTSVTVTFPSATGHVYAAGAKVCTTLPFRDLGVSLWAVTTGAAGPLQTNPAQIPLTDAATLGFAAGQVIGIISIDDPTVREEATIDAADASKITCEAFLAYDYAAGSLVVAAGSGEVPWWGRPVATLVTAEELKRLRFCVRT